MGFLGYLTHRTPMKRITALNSHKTSVSLPASSYRRLLAAQKVMLRNGVRLSEQAIYGRLLKLYLKNWRGQGLKTNGLRRYNANQEKYGIRPLYINQVLHAAVWERAVHSGESLSRILDFAIRIYLPRLMEQLLRRPIAHSARSIRNHPYWASRLAHRPRKYPDFFINYACETIRNDSNSLQYFQTSRIISKAGLSPWQILDLIRIAA